VLGEELREVALALAGETELFGAFAYDLHRFFEFVVGVRLGEFVGTCSLLFVGVGFVLLVLRFDAREFVKLGLYGTPVVESEEFVHLFLEVAVRAASEYVLG